MSGTIIAINDELDAAPERVNSDPYGDGWLFQIRIDADEELDGLIDADDYLASIVDDE